MKSLPCCEQEEKIQLKTRKYEVLSSSEDSSDSSTAFNSESSLKSTSTSTSRSPSRVKKHGGSDSKRHSSGLRKKGHHRRSKSHSPVGRRDRKSY